MTVDLTSLARFTRRLGDEAPRCEVCAAAIAEAHRHVVDRAGRRLLCACRDCVLAFDGDTGSRFRSVPDRVRVGPLQALDTELAALGVPVGLAFFLRASSLDAWIAVFPSPAGPTEAELPDEAWNELVARNEALRDIAEDVEALLIRRTRDGRAASFIVPVDLCYELVGLLRRTWQGVDGGDEARAAIDGFFARLEKASGS